MKKDGTSFDVDVLDQRLEMGDWSVEPATGKIPDPEDPFNNPQKTWYGGKLTVNF